MKNEIITLRFNYSQFPDDISNQLKESTIIIQQSVKRTCQEIIIMGLELLKAKSLIEHGHFENWYQTEFQLSKQMANKFMNAALKYGKSKIILLFKPTILYELAAPSTSDEVRTEIEQKIQQGEDVTIKEIKDLKQQNKQKDNRIKELSQSMDKNDQFFKETLQEVQQENVDTLKQLSLENDQLREQINKLESRSLIPNKPRYEPVPIQPEENNGKHEKKIKELELIIADLNQEVLSAKEIKAQDDLNIVRKIKSDFETREQGYQAIIEDLKLKIQQACESPEIVNEPIYESDSDGDTDFLLFTKFLDRLENSNNYDEQMIAQLEDIKTRIDVYLDRMQVDIF